MWYASKTATAAPERTASSPSSPSNSRARTAAGFLLGALLAGCVAAPAPKAEPEKPETAEAAAEPAPAPTPAPTPAPAPAEPKKPYEGREDIVVLDPGDEQAANSRSLVEAARAERQRRAQAGPPVAVITDKNLKKQATGQLTYAAPKTVEKGSADAAAAPAGDEPVRDEQYWRSRALEIRVRWRKAADDMKELEQAAAGWRRRFYAERDTYVRDGQIKPEWDRVLDRLEEARAEVQASVQELEEFMEEGRRAGALPGWLREGVDQEPQEEPEPSNQHEVIEPPKADGKGA